jgi:hypothetical protein
MSDRPTGPWKCKGTIMDPNPGSSGNHPGIVDFKGSSYVFGFNYAVNFSLTDKHRERRSICVEKMTYNADGSIQKHPWWSNEGVEQVGAFNPYVQTEAATICWANGIKTTNRDGGKAGVYVTATTNGAYIRLKGVDFGRKGAGNFIASVAGAGKGNAIELRLDSETGPLIGTLKIKPTGAANRWETQSCSVRGAVGVHDLYLKFTGEALPEMNFDWWKFQALR